jgi:hypothetical protein
MLGQGVTPLDVLLSTYTHLDFFDEEHVYIATLRSPSAWFHVGSSENVWSVVWNIFPYIGNVIIPTDELYHFSEGWGSTTNQMIINHH